MPNCGPVGRHADDLDRAQVRRDERQAGHPGRQRPAGQEEVEAVGDPPAGGEPDAQDDGEVGGDERVVDDVRVELQGVVHREPRLGVGQASRRAPADGTTSKVRGAACPPRANRCRDGLGDRLDRGPASTRTTALPPNPPPTMRAPCAPAATAASTQASSSRRRDLEVVAQRGVPRGQHRPDRPRVAGRRAGCSTTSSTRAFSVTMCRARRSSTASSSSGRPAAGDVGDVAQRRHAEARGGLLALAAPVAVAAVGVGVRRARCRRRAAPARRRPGRGAPARCAGRGCPGTARARPCTAARPTGRGCRSAPRRSRSPTGGPAPPGRSGSARAPTRSLRASATEQVSAADEDSPAPDRDVGVDQHAHARRPAGRAGRRRRRPGSPAQPSGRPGARSASVELDDAAVPLQRGQRDPAVGAPGDRRAGGVRQRHRQHEAVVVVGVLADDVDPAGRGPDALGLGCRTGRRNALRPLGSAALTPRPRLAAARRRPRGSCR